MPISLIYLMYQLGLEVLAVIVRSLKWDVCKTQSLRGDIHYFLLPQPNHIHQQLKQQSLVEQLRPQSGQKLLQVRVSQMLTQVDQLLRLVHCSKACPWQILLIPFHERQIMSLSKLISKISRYKLLNHLSHQRYYYQHHYDYLRWELQNRLITYSQYCSTIYIDFLSEITFGQVQCQKLLNFSDTGGVFVVFNCF